MATGEPKEYGLILPNKNKVQTLGTRKLNPLMDSDDELEKDDESSLNWVEASLKKSAGNSGQQSMQKRLLREALEEDASVFQYDEVYDEMQATKAAQVAAKKQGEEKKPKYIHNILKQAEKRKIEGERRMERKVQKEREEEGEEFADKESFVTSSYLKKMEELKQAEVEAKLEELREEKCDVTKHKNFSAFYNHLFQQKVGNTVVKEEPVDEEDKPSEVETIKKRDDSKRQKNYRNQRDLSESPEREEREKPKTSRQDPGSSDSEQEKAETYRERRDKYKAREERREYDKGKSRDSLRDKDRDRRRERDSSPERRRDHDKRYDRGRDERSRDRRSGRGRSHERERNHRGKQRSRSRSRHRRRSRSRTPQVKRDERQRRDSKSKSPQRRAKSSERVKVKEERKSPERKKENSKESANGKNSSRDKANNGTSSSSVDLGKVKKESELEEKEKRLERIRKLFTKRTVGEKFEQALQRFYQRKANRQAQG